MTHAMTRYTPAQADESGMDLAKLGDVLARSGYFQDTRDAAQAIVKVLAGRELGIGPIAAMTGIYLVKGRVTMSANLMAAQVKRSGRYTYVVAVMTDERVELQFQERQGDGWQPIGVSTFTKADAQQAGLWQSSEPWKKTPRNMLFARAMSNGCKWFTPDIFSGPVYTPDELEAQPTTAYVDTASGELIDTPAAPEPVTRPAIRNPDHPASERQVSAIYASAKEAGIPPADVSACLADYDELTKAQASTIIDLIKTAGELPPSPHAPPVASETALNEIAGLRMDLDWSKKQLADYIRAEGFEPMHLTEPQALQLIDWLTIKAGEYQSAQRQATMTDEDAIEQAVTPRNGAVGVAR